MSDLGGSPVRAEPTSAPSVAPATGYGERFYASLRDGSRRSAGVIVPLVVDLVRPQSVVDVGCGLGTWLAVFAEHGVSDVVGIDGAHVDPSRLDIPVEQFLARDLTTAIDLGRTFDLVVSVEVAEHLDAAHAATFVASLVRLGPVVLFSAAIPHQRGTNHVNEQWPAYWAGFFAGHGYVALDCIRPRVWDNAAVDFWYAQNALLFVRQAGMSDALTAARAGTHPEPMALVHPRMLEHAIARDATRPPSVRADVSHLVRSLKAAARRRLRARPGGGGR